MLDIYFAESYNVNKIGATTANQLNYTDAQEACAVRDGRLLTPAEFSQALDLICCINGYLEGMYAGKTCAGRQIFSLDPSLKQHAWCSKLQGMYTVHIHHLSATEYHYTKSGYEYDIICRGDILLNMITCQGMRVDKCTHVFSHTQ